MKVVAKFLLLLVISSCIYANDINYDEQIKIYYKSEWMFEVYQKGDREKTYKEQAVWPQRITDIELLSKNYREIVKRYLASLDLLLSHYDEDKTVELQNSYKIDWANKVIKNNKNIARIEFSQGMSLYYVVPRVLSDETKISVPTWEKQGHSEPYWHTIYWDNKIYPENIWFYESNLKICIVRKIIDSTGENHGEIMIVLYKLEDFHKYFDKNRKAIEKNIDAFVDEQRERLLKAGMKLE